MVQFHEDGKVVVLNLVCRKVRESHTAENIKKWLKEIQVEFEIKDEQILGFSADSAANMQKAAKLYLRELIVKPFFIEVDDEGDDEDDDEDGVEEMRVERESDGEEDDNNNDEYDGEDELIIESFEYINSSYNIPCVAHQLQLAIVKFNKEKSITKLLAAARSLSAKLRTPQVRRLTEKEDLPVALMDQTTRWMSTFNMTERLAVYQDFCHENDNLIKGKSVI
jgi:hypothetical protein